MSKQKNRFLCIQPDDLKIEPAGCSYGRAAVTETAELNNPRWFTEALGTQSHEHRWFDHSRRVVGCDIVCAQPYALEPEAVKEMMSFCEEWSVRWTITGMSSYYPGRTLGIFLRPTADTYAKLKLRIPVDHWRDPAKYESAA